ncbi:MAG TPA: sigma-70 family RNA polymerase sigma factor [Gemmataceae bacterium]|nr:sigma-70 family RNA polymerase sigma factor [Gemmataceae bacterium]
MTPAAESSDAQLAGMLADPAQQGEAFRLLYERHAAPLLAFATSRFRHRAEDLCQNAWLEAFRHGWKPADNVRAWLFRVVTNRGISDIRKERSVSLAGVEEPVASTADAAEPLIHAERLGRLKLCREKLRQQKPDYYAVIQAVMAEELPAAAAARLGISRANFDQRKSRALDALARCAGSEARGSDHP